jgi:hypothetical protein
MNDFNLQVLRTIDKYDKIGADGVFRLLTDGMKDKESGAYIPGVGLDKVNATLLVEFIQTTGNSNEETLENMEKWFSKAAKIKNRIDLMILMEETVIDSKGTTLWDILIHMSQNENETWENGGRPKNIAWALDDILESDMNYIQFLNKPPSIGIEND